MAVTNKRKEETCEKYKIYLKIIYYFSNKVILAKQLYEYAVALNIVQYKIDFWKQISELKRYEILKSEPFVAFDKVTQNEVLILKKYAIRFIEEKEKSSDVAAVPKRNSNERILLSIFKNKYILNKIIPITRRRGELTYDNIVRCIKSKHSSILYNKNMGLEYLIDFEKVFVAKYISQTYIENAKDDFLTSRRNQKKGLEAGRKSSEGKGSGGKILSGCADPVRHFTNKEVKKEYISAEEARAINKEIDSSLSPKFRMLETYNFDRMFSNNMHVVDIKNKDNKVLISMLIFDIANSRNIHKIALNISATYNMFKRYLKCEFNLRIGVITYDQDSQIAIENDAKVRTINYNSREKNELNKLENYLKLNGLDDVDRENIEIVFSNYNLTNEYFDGIKYANILKNNK